MKHERLCKKDNKKPHHGIGSNFTNFDLILLIFRFDFAFFSWIFIGFGIGSNMLNLLSGLASSICFGLVVAME